VKEVPPAVIVVAIVVVVAILGIVGWKVMAPPTYTGGPINMGQAMKGGSGGAGHTGAPATGPTGPQHMGGGAPR